MDGNMELESYGNSIEGALCAYDIENERKLNDSDAIRIVDLLIDKYYFRDETWLRTWMHLRIMFMF